MQEAQAFFTVAWDMGECRINGPYPSFTDAAHVILEDCGPTEQAGIIGPVPFKQIVRDGDRIEDATDNAS